MRHILILILSLIIIFLFFYLNDQVQHIDYYVISLQSKDRLDQINRQIYKNDLKINIFYAVNGYNLNQDDLIKQGTLLEIFKENTKSRHREIGCYMSHLTLLEFIKNKKDNKKYSVILEDDFEIVNDNFKDTIKKIINSDIDNFDMIILGNLNNNHGIQIHKNIYHFDNNNNYWGSYAYLINNNSLDKIINLINKIDKPIDIKYEELIKNKKINALVIFPTIINANFGLVSTIIE